MAAMDHRHPAMLEIRAGGFGLAKVLLDNAGPLSLCASPDETRVYYNRHTDAGQDEDWLITNGQPEQLHLQNR